MVPLFALPFCHYWNESVKESNTITELKAQEYWTSWIEFHYTLSMSFFSYPIRMNPLGAAANELKSFKKSLQNHNQSKFKIQCIKLPTTICEAILNMGSFGLNIQLVTFECTYHIVLIVICSLFCSAI